MHLLDESSLLLLVEVQSQSAGVMVLCTCSSEEKLMKESTKAHNGPVSSLLKIVNVGIFHSMELTCLDKDSIVDLINDVLNASKGTTLDKVNISDKVIEVCGGNPFVAVEIARALAANGDTVFDIKEAMNSLRVEEVICHRFSKLAFSAQYFLKIAAVACSSGSSFTLALIADVSDYSNTGESLDSLRWTAKVLLSLVAKDSFLRVSASDSELTVDSLMSGCHEFLFKVTLEQRVIYNLLLDDQKQEIHLSIAEYLSHQRQLSYQTNYVQSFRDEGFHFENALLYHSAMASYFNAFLCELDNLNKNVHLEMAFSMYSYLKESTEMLPDSRGISYADLLILLDETFDNDGKSMASTDVKCVENASLTSTLSLNRVFQIFGGDTKILEIALSVILKFSLQYLRQHDGSVPIQLVLEDVIQMIMLTKTPFLMSSNYLTNLVNSVTEGVCHVEEVDMYFCLYDRFSDYCLVSFSAYLLNFFSSSSVNSEYTQKALFIGDVFLTIARNGLSIHHLIQALCMHAMVYLRLGHFEQLWSYVVELQSLYVFEEHSKQLIETYESDQAIVLLARTAKYCFLIGEIEKAHSLMQTCLQFVSSSSDITTVTKVVFRLISILAYTRKYPIAQAMWTRFTRLVQETKPFPSEQIPGSVIHFFSVWLSQHIVMSPHHNYSNSHSALESVNDRELMEVGQLIYMERDVVYGFRSELCLALADYCMLQVLDFKDGGNVGSIKNWCNLCCKYMHAIMSSNIDSSLELFYKASCVQIANQVCRSSELLLPFRTLFTSDILQLLRDEAEVKCLLSLDEILSALYLTLHGQQL